MTPLDAVAGILGRGNVAVLTGAGISTESGIPDYRGPSGATLRRHAPMTYQVFTGDPNARRRYWARGYLGWHQFAKAPPNAGHHAVAAMERSGVVSGVITQNVDGLHQRAGTQAVIDLHGRLDRVICLACQAIEPRPSVHARIAEANADWNATVTAINPDGDVDIAEEHLDSFTIVDCRECDGTLKPDVVYFGENVPAVRVEESYALVDASDALFVLGSSLHVFSGRRFVMRAAKDGKPVVIVNQGPTKGDAFATHRVDAPLGETLQALASVVVS
jgi:NAD-dependent SIR2 family protein deacetylase